MTYSVSHHGTGGSRKTTTDGGTQHTAVTRKMESSSGVSAQGDKSTSWLTAKLRVRKIFVPPGRGVLALRAQHYVGGCPAHIDCSLRSRFSGMRRLYWYLHKCVSQSMLYLENISATRFPPFVTFGGLARFGEQHDIPGVLGSSPFPFGHLL